MKLNAIISATLFSLLPLAAEADVLELSQSQMRQLVVQQQVLSAETIVDGAARNFGGVVMDIRGFLSEGQMTYRLLLQRNDGSVVEVLVNGVSGTQVSHNTNMGQVVSAVARATNGAQRSATQASSPASDNRNGNASSNAGNRNSNASSNSSNRNSNASSNSRGNSASSNGKNNRSNNGNGNGNGKNK